MSYFSLCVYVIYKPAEEPHLHIEIAKSLIAPAALPYILVQFCVNLGAQ